MASAPVTIYLNELQPAETVVSLLTGKAQFYIENKFWLAPGVTHIKPDMFNMSKKENYELYTTPSLYARNPVTNEFTEAFSIGTTTRHNGRSIPATYIINKPYVITGYEQSTSKNLEVRFSDNEDDARVLAVLSTQFSIALEVLLVATIYSIDLKPCESCDNPSLFEYIRKHVNAFLTKNHQREVQQWSKDYISSFSNPMTMIKLPRQTKYIPADVNGDYATLIQIIDCNRGIMQGRMPPEWARSYSAQAMTVVPSHKIFQYTNRNNVETTMVKTRFKFSYTSNGKRCSYPTLRQTGKSTAVPLNATSMGVLWGGAITGNDANVQRYGRWSGCLYVKPQLDGMVTTYTGISDSWRVLKVIANRASSSSSITTEEGSDMFVDDVEPTDALTPEFDDDFDAIPQSTEKMDFSSRPSYRATRKVTINDNYE